MVDAALADDMNGVIPEEPQEFRHATSLDGALEHLIPTLQTNKGLFVHFCGLSLQFLMLLLLGNVCSSRCHDYLPAFGVLLQLCVKMLISILRKFAKLGIYVFFSFSPLSVYQKT